MGTIRFTLRTDKTDCEGKHPIEIVYQVAGQRQYFRISSKLLPGTWDKDNQRARYIDKKMAKKLAPGVDYNLFPTESEVKEINSKIINKIMEIENIEKRYEI